VIKPVKFLKMSESEEIEIIDKEDTEEGCSQLIHSSRE